MLEDEMQEQIGVDRIVFGATGIKGFAETGQALGVDRVGHQMFKLQQGREKRAAGLLHTDGDFAVGESGAQAIGPLDQGFGGLWHSRAFDAGGIVGCAEAKSVLFVGPIQADKSGEDQRCKRGGFDFVLWTHERDCLVSKLRARWLGLSEGLIAETFCCRHLSSRLGPKRRAGAKLWANSSNEMGCLFVIQRGVTAAFRAGGNCSQNRWEHRAKLFTVGCGESTKLSSPPMNNFGTTIRVARHELPWENEVNRSQP